MLLPRYQYYVMKYRNIVFPLLFVMIYQRLIYVVSLVISPIFVLFIVEPFSLYRFAQIRTSNDSIDFCWVVVVVDRNRSSLNVISFIKNNLLVHASLRYRFVYLSSVSFCVKLVLLCNWCWRKRYENCRLRGRTENSMLWLVI